MKKKPWISPTKKKLWIFLDYTRFGVFVVNFADKANSSVWMIPGTATA
jgi:hypothetical protein